MADTEFDQPERIELLKDLITATGSKINLGSTLWALLWLSDMDKLRYLVRVAQATAQVESTAPIRVPPFYNIFLRSLGQSIEDSVRLVPRCRSTILIVLTSVANIMQGSRILASILAVQLAGPLLLHLAGPLLLHLAGPLSVYLTRPLPLRFIGHQRLVLRRLLLCRTLSLRNRLHTRALSVHLTRRQWPVLRRLLCRPPTQQTPYPYQCFVGSSDQGSVSSSHQASAAGPPQATPLPHVFPPQQTPYPHQGSPLRHAFVPQHTSPFQQSSPPDYRFPGQEQNYSDDRQGAATRSGEQTKQVSLINYHH
jgi:hypothetical protein